MINHDYYTLTGQQLCSLTQQIMWQQCKAYNYEHAGQKIQLKETKWVKFQYIFISTYALRNYPVSRICFHVSPV